MTPKRELRKIRKSLGWTQRKLAQKLKVHWVTVSRWETGHTDVPWMVLLVAKSLRKEEELTKV